VKRELVGPRVARPRLGRAHFQHGSGRRHVHRVLHDPTRVRDGRRAEVVDLCRKGTIEVGASGSGPCQLLFLGVFWRGGEAWAKRENGKRRRTSRLSSAPRGAGFGNTATRDATIDVVMSSRARRHDCRRVGRKFRFLVVFSQSIDERVRSAPAPSSESFSKFRCRVSRSSHHRNPMRRAHGTLGVSVLAGDPRVPRESTHAVPTRPTRRAAHANRS